MGTQFGDEAGMGWMTNFAKVSSMIFMDNMRCIADLVFGGVCHRFPDLKLVSVESGVGWIPAAMETFDWQWRNGGVRDEHPEYDLLPSEYFRRQIYGCFWFEQQGALDAIAQYPDNILFESDYPHPTCQHPGPRTPGRRPRDYAQELLGGLPDDVVRKVLHDNAAAIYGVKRASCPSSTPPTSGASTSSRTSTVACCTCGSTGWRSATPSRRTCTAVSSAPRSGPTANPSWTRCASPAPATGSVPVVTSPATPKTPRGSRPSGTAPTTSRSVTSSVVASCGWPRSTARASPAVSISRCTVT